MHCFNEICIMLSDLVSALSWISSRHGRLSYQREEGRTSVERNGLSKGRTELSCQDTLIVLQIGSRWGKYEREEIRGKRESLNQGWHCQDLSIKGRFGLAGVENRWGSNILYCGGWHHSGVLQGLVFFFNHRQQTIDTTDQIYSYKNTLLLLLL